MKTPVIVNEQAMRTTVLIIDDDLGFVFWLGRTLDTAGYQSLPAKDISDATTLLCDLTSKIDLLIINPALPSASEFVSMLRRSKADLKVVFLSQAVGMVAAPISGADASRRKPVSVVDEITKLEWLELVHSLLGDSALKC